MTTKSPFKYVAVLALSLGMVPHGFAQQSTPSSIQKKVAGLYSNAKDNELLGPDEAFKFKIAVKGPRTLVADLTPAPGYYLYKERIHFTLKDTKGVLIKTVNLPTGEIKTDASFGKMEVYKHPIQAEITLDRTTAVKTVTVVASYQGCQEKIGVCYSPIEKTVTVALP